MVLLLLDPCWTLIASPAFLFFLLELMALVALWH